MRYRYIGTRPSVTLDPPGEWQPGEVRDVDQAINNPAFVPVPEPVPVPEEDEEEEVSRG